MPTLQDLEAALRKHDWFHEYSDDHRVWKRGVEQWEAIRAMYMELRDAGQGDAAEAMIKDITKEMTRA